MQKKQRDERISMQCPACGFIAFDLPGKFVNEYHCLKCQQTMLFRHPEPFRKTSSVKPASTTINQPASALRKYVLAGAGTIAAGIILLLGFHAYGNHVRAQEQSRALRAASQASKQQAQKLAALNEKYAKRLDRVLDKREPETRRRLLLRLQQMVADTGEQLPVSKLIDRALVRVLSLLHEQNLRRLSAYARQQQKLTDLRNRLEEKAADFEARAKVLEIKADALTVKFAEREHQLARREREAAKILQQKNDIARYVAKTHKQGSKIETQVKRLDDLEIRMKAREAQLVKREKQLEKREDKIAEAMTEIAKQKSSKVVVVQPRQPTSSIRIYRDRYVYPAPIITSSAYNSILSPYYYNSNTYYRRYGLHYYHTKTYQNTYGYQHYPTNTYNCK